MQVLLAGDLVPTQLNMDILKNEYIHIYKDEELRNYFCKKSLKRIKDFDIKNIIKEWESII